MFDGLHELMCFNEAFMCPRIQPRIAAVHAFYAELPFLEIYVVEVCDFQFAAVRRLNLFGVAGCVLVVEVQPRYRVV